MKIKGGMMKNVQKVCWLLFMSVLAMVFYAQAAGAEVLVDETVTYPGLTKAAKCTDWKVFDYSVPGTGGVVVTKWMVDPLINDARAGRAFELKYGDVQYKYGTGSGWSGWSGGIPYCCDGDTSGAKSRVIQNGNDGWGGGWGFRQNGEEVKNPVGGIPLYNSWVTYQDRGRPIDKVQVAVLPVCWPDSFSGVNQVEQEIRLKIEFIPDSDTSAPPVSQPSTNSKTLAEGETWNVGEGYTLKAGAIDAKAGQIWLILSKNGKELDDGTVNVGKTYTYSNLKIKVTKISAGAVSDTVTLTDASAASPSPVITPAGYYKLDLNPIGYAEGRGGEFLYKGKVPIGGNVIDGGRFKLPWFSSNSRHRQTETFIVPDVRADSLYIAANNAWWSWGAAFENQPILEIEIAGTEGTITRSLVSGQNIFEWNAGVPAGIASNTEKVSNNDPYTTSTFVTRFEFPSMVVQSVKVRLLVKTNTDESRGTNQQVIEMFGITLGADGGTKWSGTPTPRITPGVTVTSPTTCYDNGMGASGGNCIYSNGNVGGVYNNPTSQTTFTLTNTYNVMSISTYHYNSGRGATPGTISLKNSNGKTVGTWTATGRYGNFYWDVTPNINLGPGTYTVIDSDTSTWAQNSETKNQGMFIVKGTLATTTGITPGVTAKRTTPKPGATTPQGDFTVSISPTEMTVDPGENIRFTLTVEPEGDFNEPVEVYVKTEVLGIEKDYGRVKIITPPYKPYVFEKQVPDSIPKGTTITGYVTARSGGLERDAGTVTVNVPGFGTLLAIGALGMAILLRKRK